ncbi:hypothetical protein TNIN_85941 [Trichonephila inaurata madagascariensis]|uniref:Uncharacterized protein n=1 Tax=Trichonephila inaurata madagascariensis TaxID=2747483 RepID=A0A8X7CMF8_9ARAC|nr:hypothetical protein TNIN_85941 [Trichonephila inaurata madagascariensis]
MAQNSFHCLSFRTLHKFRFLRQEQEISQSINWMSSELSADPYAFSVLRFRPNICAKQFVKLVGAGFSTAHRRGAYTETISRLELEERLCVWDKLSLTPLFRREDIFN